MLLSEGLLGAANRLLCLPKGYYGLSTIVLFVALMTLARVRNPESLRYQAPGEWGCVLGLDRCPEVKTHRRKIKLLAHAEQTVRDWQAALARAWHDADQDLYATLAVDGHVKVYAGRKGKLAEHFIARQKLAFRPAPATGSTLWAKPLLCVHKPLDPKMVKALEHDIVPRSKRSACCPNTRPTSVPNSGAPAITLVFDREGWTAVFRRLARRGLAVIGTRISRARRGPRISARSTRRSSARRTRTRPGWFWPKSRSSCRTRSPSARSADASTTAVRWR